MLSARLEVNPHYTQLFPSDALMAAAQREAKRKSDARIFLDLCKKSLLAARDQGAPHVTTDIVLITDAAPGSDDGPASTLSPQHIVILIALLRRSHNGAAASVDQLKAAVEGMRTGIYQNRTPAEWLNALETLDSAGFVSLNLDAHPKLITPRTTWEVVRRLAEGKLSHLLTDDDNDM